MFTGIVQAVGRIAAKVPSGSGVRLRIESEAIPWTQVKVGDSIAVSGVCLTVVEIDTDGFNTDLSPETLHRTTFHHAGVGTPVNLELAMTPTTRFGGHIVTGHVDGVAEVVARWDEGEVVHLSLRVPKEYAKYLAPKGSIALDGVSLTVSRVDGEEFEVVLIPHTLATTTLGRKEVGDQLNFEVDIIARYLERLLAQRGTG